MTDCSFKLFTVPTTQSHPSVSATLEWRVSPSSPAACSDILVQVLPPHGVPGAGIYTPQPSARLDGGYTASTASSRLVPAVVGGVASSALEVAARCVAAGCDWVKLDPVWPEQLNENYLEITSDVLPIIYTPNPTSAPFVFGLGACVLLVILSAILYLSFHHKAGKCLGPSVVSRTGCACSVCTNRSASWYCPTCKDSYCEDCLTQIHNPAEGDDPAAEHFVQRIMTCDRCNQLVPVLSFYFGSTGGGVPGGSQGTYLCSMCEAACLDDMKEQGKPHDEIRAIQNSAMGITECHECHRHAATIRCGDCRSNMCLDCMHTQHQKQRRGKLHAMEYLIPLERLRAMAGI